MRKWINLFENRTFTPSDKLFFVPIRFWEEQEPETGRLADPDSDNDSDVLDPEDYEDDPTNAHVYVYHDGYGHNVYMDRDRTFASREEAIADAHRRIAEKDAKEDAEMEIIMKRMAGTADPEPEPEPRGAVFVPDVGTLVQIDDPTQFSDQGGLTKGKRRYRVNGWMKTATPPPPAPKNPHDTSGHMASLMQHILYSTEQGIGPDNKRLVACVRKEAEYLSCSGVSGAIIRVGDAEVVGRVPWSEEMIDDLRASALRRVGQRY
jgi:hypothetical protein